MAIIRKNPLFEIYMDYGHLTINNTDYQKDNRTIDIENIVNVELIRNLSFLNKFIEVTFGLYLPAKSNELRINMENGFKDIILTDCDIKKVELLIYEINKKLNQNSDFQ